jgi:thiamine-phosphate diphosphorylase
VSALAGRRGIICLVTDSRRMGGVEADAQARHRTLLTLVRSAAEAAIDLVQIRERQLEARQLAAIVSDAVAAVGGSGTRIIVNDRLDVALVSGAHGVHLRGDSMTPEAARSISPPDFLVGRSVRGPGEAQSASSTADYLIAGTVFATPSKPGLARLLGLAGLAEISRAASVPVLAIGGVNLQNAAVVAGAGASGAAGISLFLGEGSGLLPVRSLRAIVDDLRAAFDTGRSAT